MRIVLLALCVALASAAPASAYKLFDNFENGVGGTPHQWQVLTSANGSGSTLNGINNRLTTSSDHNITPAGVNSARAFASDPAAWNAYADFGTTLGKFEASVWMYEDRNYSELDNPLNNQPVNAWTRSWITS